MAGHEMRERWIEVELGRINPFLKDYPYRVPYESVPTVEDLLDQVYLALSDHVGIYTYGKEWLLQGSAGDKSYVDAGRDWARHNLGRHARARRPRDPSGRAPRRGPGTPLVGRGADRDRRVSGC
ncbi:hypothetical protein [Sphaerisporangium sp. NPDC051011]|uniref:hypothetical protein n=1 Tax=Sphaerisporangium sp. NPDC051011 TaxID=3155792 RepID=UPI0033EE35F1